MPGPRAEESAFCRLWRHRTDILESAPHQSNWLLPARRCWELNRIARQSQYEKCSSALICSLGLFQCCAAWHPLMIFCLPKLSPTCFIFLFETSISHFFVLFNVFLLKIEPTNSCNMYYFAIYKLLFFWLLIFSDHLISFNEISIASL